MQIIITLPHEVIEIKVRILVPKRALQELGNKKSLAKVALGLITSLWSHNYRMKKITKI
jgi:hypothetical protein